jgi:DNA repair ATPase RecN
VTSVRALDPAERVTELAEMVRGRAVTESATETARELLQGAAAAHEAPAWAR